MNFSPELAAKVMAGAKTVTRRICSDNPRSPWALRGCSLKVGRDYAVCPGRGKNAIGRVRVLDVRISRLGDVDDEEARREGFDNAEGFRRAFHKINGEYDPDLACWRVEFEPVPPEGYENVRMTRWHCEACGDGFDDRDAITARCIDCSESMVPTEIVGLREVDAPERTAA